MLLLHQQPTSATYGPEVGGEAGNRTPFRCFQNNDATNLILPQVGKHTLPLGFFELGVGLRVESVHDLGWYRESNPGRVVHSHAFCH